MTTALTVIKGAMRDNGVLMAGESATAEEAADGLEALNQMLHSFPADGIEYAHTTIAVISGAVPIPEELIAHVRAMLAVRWASEFGAVAPPNVQVAADNGRRFLQGYYKQAKTAPVDGGLPTGHGGTYTMNDWTSG